MNIATTKLPSLTKSLSRKELIDGALLEAAKAGSFADVAGHSVDSFVTKLKRYPGQDTTSIRTEASVAALHANGKADMYYKAHKASLFAMGIGGATGVASELLGASGLKVASTIAVGLGMFGALAFSSVADTESSKYRHAVSTLKGLDHWQAHLQA